MFGCDGRKKAENLRVVMFHFALEKGNEVNIVQNFIWFDIYKKENQLFTSRLCN